MEQAPVLSFPAILRNPGLSDRFAHLRVQEQAVKEQATSKSRPATTKREKEGKRWIRRKDNARFTDNPHVVLAAKADYTLPIPEVKATFPEPLPPFLHRNTKIPNVNAPPLDPNSANAGRFSLSLKGMRRSLRKSGFRAESLVRDIESEVLQWLEAGGSLLNLNQENLSQDPVATGMPLRNTETIFEVSRSPLQLIWYTNEDNFARYVIHCCARYHEVVSFSKEISGRRLTYLLRPNVARPDHHATSALATPPASDTDYSSHFDTESDRGSIVETDSDAESTKHDGRPDQTLLSAIDEDSDGHAPLPHSDEDNWSLVGDDEVDVASAADRATNILASKASPRTPRHRTIMRRRSNHGRGVSSPSRSPVPQPFRRPAPCQRKTSSTRPQTFYEFLYN